MSSSEFPRPDVPLALCDIDGTLIDGSYAFTDPDIYGVVEDVQNAGWTLGLSSDTPYEGMVRYRDMLGMNGPIIAEKGSVVELAGSLSYDIEEAQLFAAAFSAIKRNLTDEGVVMWEGNPVEAIYDKLKIGNVGDMVVLMNSLRKCSLGIFPRQINETGDMVIDDNLTNKIVEQVRPLYPDLPDLGEDLNHDYGLLILSREAITKRRGSQKLIALGGIAGRFAMIGNSAADYVGSDLAVHYAVGDATTVFREQADYVAGKPGTAGVVEILRQLIR